MPGFEEIRISVMILFTKNKQSSTINIDTFKLMQKAKLKFLIRL